MGADNGTSHYIHDIFGNVIVEANGSGTTQREYILIPGVGYAGVSLPLANVEGSTLYYVHTDHLSRPIKMTDTSKASVWTTVYGPFGQPHSITGSASNNQRFPGQWHQLEAGLAYNWHRHYDPSLGRYTQPDPLGFVDGPSVYAYALSNPHRYVDPDGRNIIGGVIAFGKYCLKLLLRKPSLSRSQEKAIRTLKKRIKEHEKKLEDFRKRPEDFDNKDFQKNAPTEEIRDRIIERRKEHLRKEMETFKKNIDDITGGD